jgi:hypothetical protein
MWEKWFDPNTEVQDLFVPDVVFLEPSVRKLRLFACACCRRIVNENSLSWAFAGRVAIVVFEADLGKGEATTVQIELLKLDLEKVREALSQEGYSAERPDVLGDLLDEIREHNDVWKGLKEGAELSQALRKIDAEEVDNGAHRLARNWAQKVSRALRDRDEYFRKGDAYLIDRLDAELRAAQAVAQIGEVRGHDYSSDVAAAAAEVARWAREAAWHLEGEAHAERWGVWGMKHTDDHPAIVARAEAAMGERRRQEGRAQAAILRDIVGNPNRSPTAASFDARWLTSTVCDLAHAIFVNRAFDQMPILADALMDAGCDSEEIMNHCRDAGMHFRGCWVIDLLLSKDRQDGIVR